MRRKLTFGTFGTRVAVPVGFFALVSVAALSFILITSLRDQVFAEAVHGSESIADAIRLTVQHDMRTNRRDGVREIIEAFGQHVGVKEVRLFNEQGQIEYSSRPDEVGRTVPRTAEPCVGCHAGPVPVRDLAPSDRSRVYTSPSGQRLLATIRVVRNQQGCQGSGCHLSPSRQSVLGVLDVTMSLEPAQARIAGVTRNALFISLAAVILITGTLFMMVWRNVHRPINRIVAATRRAAHGESALHVPHGSTAEIGILANSINEMVESLNSSRSRAEEWAATLEDNLADKAKALKDAEYQVVQAEKLSSVGLVAAGIAHEINSPLMAIITFVHLVRSRLDSETEAYQDLSMIEHEANRVAAIVRQLLDYSRKQAQEPEIEPCSIGPVVRRALELLKVEIQNGGIDVHVSIPDDLPRVEANDVQLMQIFVNLCMNAIQAMPEGGSLYIDSSVVSRSELGSVNLPPHPSSTLIRTRVRDTGVGIAPESISKVFDPFFTTKPVGQGSGLGLSVSLGLVRGYRGTILVESDGSSGTTFTVLIPVAQEPGASEES